MTSGLEELSWWVSLGAVKKRDIDDSRSFVRVFHVALVFVWRLSVRSALGQRDGLTKLDITALPYMNAPAVYVHWIRRIALQFPSIKVPS